MHQDSPAKLATPSAFGLPFEGGFYAGMLRVGDKLCALIVAPKAEGESSLKWHPKRADVPGARSFFDGLANSDAMAQAGCPAGAWARGLQIGGFSDWYLPSRDELELLYRNLKPTDDGNATLSGDNPSSVPPGWAYTEEAPQQTTAEAFRRGGEQALDPVWYWASTQLSESFAWGQDFVGGYQGNYVKGYEARARAVRRLVIE